MGNEEYKAFFEDVEKGKMINRKEQNTTKYCILKSLEQARNLTFGKVFPDESLERNLVD
jgi:hypothetical protein